VTALSWRQPLRVSPLRSVAEADAGYAVLLVLGTALDAVTSGAGSLPAGLLVALGWIWLFFWPAWRLRPIRGHRWWAHWALGTGRALLLIGALGLSAAILTQIATMAGAVWPLSRFRFSDIPALVFLITVGFGVTRAAVLSGAWVLRRVQARLRWRLMASHVAVITLTFATLTALGSVAGLGIFLHAAQPNSVEMAKSVAAQLELTGQPANPSRARRVFLAIASGRLSERGQPKLSFLIGSDSIPQGLALLTPGGKVLAAVQPAHRGPLTARRWSGLPGVTPAVWSSLHSAALQGRPAAVSVQFPGTAPGESSNLAEVPLEGAHGRPQAILFVAAGGPRASTTQYFRAVIVLFGATTIILISIAGIPLLAVSFLFSYFVARGLTRRLEAVSRVATAVAGGNFAERAPVSSQDEVGRLAEDVNRMAGRLERLVAELTQARSQAEEALQTRQSLVANVSHELRTPLAVLHAHLESIAARDTVPARMGAAGEISVPAGTIEALRGETRRLASMIDDLFALSRVETGGLALECRPVNVGAVVDDVVRVMRPLAQAESAVALSPDIPPGLPLVWADPNRLHQILSNLVRNAIRHTPEGGIVVLSARAEGDHVDIGVSDTGEGIAPEDLPHVFDRFYRADPSRTRSTGGAGLGLAIVRELVELMGGTVQADSTPGQGSTFTVSLPISRLGGWT
jgi:signal transduction histidine kinase